MRAGDLKEIQIGLADYLDGGAESDQELPTSQDEGPVESSSESKAPPKIPPFSPDELRRLGSEIQRVNREAEKVLLPDYPHGATFERSEKDPSHEDEDEEEVKLEKDYDGILNEMGRDEGEINRIRLGRIESFNLRGKVEQASKAGQASDEDASDRYEEYAERSDPNWGRK